MRKEIILPPHLYDRIRASAGEHGGIGFREFFVGGEPHCAHGHAWGSESNHRKACFAGRHITFSLLMGAHPELLAFISPHENDKAVRPLWSAVLGIIRRRHPLQHHISFEKWCRRLNVKRGVEAPTATPAETEMAVA